MDGSGIPCEKLLLSNDICGLCLRAYNQIDISQEVQEGTLILALVEKYISAELPVTPKRICTNCSDELIRINEFIETWKHNIACFKVKENADCVFLFKNKSNANELLDCTIFKDEEKIGRAVGEKYIVRESNEGNTDSNKLKKMFMSDVETKGEEDNPELTKSTENSSVSTPYTDISEETSRCPKNTEWKNNSEHGCVNEQNKLSVCVDRIGVFQFKEIDNLTKDNINLNENDSRRSNLEMVYVDNLGDHKRSCRKNKKKSLQNEYTKYNSVAGQRKFNLKPLERALNTKQKFKQINNLSTKTERKMEESKLGLNIKNNIKNVSGPTKEPNLKSDDEGTFRLNKQKNFANATKKHRNFPLEAEIHVGAKKCEIKQATDENKSTKLGQTFQKEPELKTASPGTHKSFKMNQTRSPNYFQKQWSSPKKANQLTSNRNFNQSKSKLNTFDTKQGSSKSVNIINAVQVSTEVTETVKETRNISSKHKSLSEKTKTTQDWVIQSVRQTTTTELKSCNFEDFRRASSSSLSEEDADVKSKRVTSTSTYRSEDDFDRLSIAKSDFICDTSRSGYEYKCDYCPCSFMLVSSLAHHKKVHGITIISKPYLCEHCGETFMNFSKFRTHRKDHSLEQPYLCLYCEKVVRGPLIYNNHIRYHTVELGELSTVDKMDVIEKLRFRGKFVCVLCGKLFAKERVLQTHLFWHPDEAKLFGCSYCDKTFTQKRSLRNHELLHKGEKKYDKDKLKPNTC